MTLEDTTLHEVACYECSKPISSIPAWMAGAKVKFQCEECRQKHPRVPGMMDIEPRRGIGAVDELGDLGDIVEDAGDDMDDEDEAEDMGE